MSSTLTVMKSAVYVQTQIKNQRLSVNNLEPMMTAANTVLQLMTGPPFRWRQNRFSFTFPITKTGGTDYVQSLPNLYFIEEQWLTDSNAKILGLGGAISLQKNSSPKRPTLVAPQYDDNQGNITFRFDAVPDQNYTANFDGQQKPPILSSPGQTFGVLSDEYGYLINKGMLSEGALLVNDARFTVWRREWIAGLLATQDGLSAQAKQMFYEQMTNTGSTSQRASSMSQQGNAGRGI